MTLLHLPTLIQCFLIETAGTSHSYSSHCPRAEQRSAEKELAMLLAGDPVLCPLYTDALKDRAIGAGRFIRNLRHLLHS